MKMQQEVLEECWLKKDPVKRYWEPKNQDIFKITDYKVVLNQTYLPEWEDLAYYVRRGKIENVQEILKKTRKWDPNTPVRPTGEILLHICAEYNQVELFEWLWKSYPNMDIMHAN